MGSIHKYELYVLQNIYNIFLIKKLTTSYIHKYFSSLASYTVLSSRFYIHNTRPFHLKSFLLKSGFWNEFIDLVETKQDIKQYMYDYPNSKISQKKTLIHFQPRYFCTYLCVFFSVWTRLPTSDLSLQRQNQR